MKIQTIQLSLAVALAIGLSPAVANGQQQDQARSTATQSRGETAVPQTAEKSLAQLFATELALANHCELQLAQMASDETKSQQVKQYAQTLIRDHQQLNRDLVRLFPEIAQIEGMKAHVQAGLDGNDGASVIRQRDDAAIRQVVKTTGIVKAQTNNTGELIRICTEATKIKCEMSKEMLAQYQGPDFDMAFVGQQIACHVALVAQLQAVNNSKVELEDLQPVLQKAEEAARQHLELAKQLSKQFENASPAKNAQGGGNR